MKIYVGNLSFDITEEELAGEFGAFGKVETASIVTDRATGRPRGFAFVEMPARTEAEAAIAALNGKSLKDRVIIVNESRPSSESRSGGSAGNRRGGAYGNRGYGSSSGGRPGGGKPRRY